MAELEKILESERADSKKRLEEAEQREIDLMQAQKVEVSRLLGLASHVGGILSSPFSLSLFLFVVVCLVVILVYDSFCSPMRCCSSIRL